MSEQAELPKRNVWLFGWFRWYVRRMFRGKFDALRLSRSSVPVPEGDLPLIVVLNHPGWWDPMVCVVLSELFGDRAHFAPIESAALEQYKVFTKLGFFGIEPGTRRGAAKFLRIAEAILAQPNHVLWITAQGEFRDVRQRPLGLRPGVGFLTARLAHGAVLPLAIEYVFWQESKPECLVRFGTPLHLSAETELDGRGWTERIEKVLTENMDTLAAEVLQRDPALFSPFVQGKVGIGGIYDSWRWFKALVRGERFDPRHEASSSHQDGTLG